jgi:dynein heavy chain
MENPAPDIIPESGWNLAFVLESTVSHTFGGLSEHITNNLDGESGWRVWMECKEPHNQALPEPWSSEDDFDTHDVKEGLSLQEKMLILKCFREEKLTFSIANFVTERLGRKFVESPPTDMKNIYSDSDFKTPVIFILSTGADPTGMLLTLAKQMKYDDRLHVISLGQGQGIKAQRLIEMACKSGDWVLLQNCHLAKSWMPQLEKEVDKLSDTVTPDGEPISVNEDFRLFLTSMPANYFPVPTLQNSVKLTNEPPKGLRANIFRSVVKINDTTDYEECTGVNGVRTWKKLVFGA